MTFAVDWYKKQKGMNSLGRMGACAVRGLLGHVDTSAAQTFPVSSRPRHSVASQPANSSNEVVIDRLAASLHLCCRLHFPLQHGLYDKIIPVNFPSLTPLLIIPLLLISCSFVSLI